MAKARELKPRELRWQCPTTVFRFTSTANVPELDGPIGQERARAALDFGADITSEGYNVFVMGPSGTGRNSTTRNTLQERAAALPAADDWCYVYNFDDARYPAALHLPPGLGPQLRDDLAQMLRDIQQNLASAFEGDEYNEKRDEIVKEFRDERNKELQAFEQEAQTAGFALGRSPAGLIVAPAIEGEVMTPQQYGDLDDEDRQRLDKTREELQEKLGDIMRRGQREEKETRERVQQLDRQAATEALQAVFEELRARYAAVAGVMAHLNRIEQDIVENIGALRRAGDEDEQQTPGMPPGMMPTTPRNPLDRYQVNVLVTHDPDAGAPIVYETNPTLDKLTGEIEHQAQMGAMITDFTMIKPGALHRANGGYLILEALPLLLRPFAWEALKRALKNRQVKIESLSDQYRFISTVTLDPEPIPLDVKVALVGSPMIYYLLYAHDEDFGKLFKVQADFGSDLDRTDEAMQQYAQFVAHICQKDGLLPFNRAAVARLVEQGAEMAGDQNKLTASLMDIADLVREAAYWARKNDKKRVAPEDVEHAVAQKIWRSNRLEERLLELLQDGTIMVDTTGEVVGQVNGLSIMTLGDYMIGRPSRLTCRTFTGRSGVMQIDREVKLTGRLHDKGLLTLTGFLGDRFGRQEQVQFSATLSFEQLYSDLDGDSASSTELYSLLSSLADAPLKQGIAVTGSVNQKGEVQPIGGVSRKIEGFYKVCQLQGLTGEQGVVIPATNERHLMLSREVVEAVRQGQFNIWSVKTIDEGIELLSGLPAGKPKADGEYPPDTIYGRVQRRLREIAEALRDSGKKDNGEGQGESWEDSGGNGEAKIKRARRKR